MREEKFRVVSATDPAIDKERMPWATMQKYWATRDFALVEPYLKAVVGKDAPIVYHVRPIPNELFESWVDVVDIDSWRWKRAFMAGVELVENLPQRDGTSTSWTRSSGSQHMTEEEAGRFPAEARKEIGRVIYEHSFLDPRKPLNLPPPHMSERYLLEKDFLIADASQSTAGVSS